MSHRSTASFGGSNASFQTNIFKVRQAKLKKFLLDMSATSGKVTLSHVKQALESNNITLTNQVEFFQFVKNWQHRVKVDSVMQWVNFIKVGNKEEIYATMTIPTINELAEQMAPSKTKSQKDFQTPRRPPRPKSGVLNIPNRSSSQGVNKTQDCSDSDFELDSAFMEQRERVPKPPSRSRARPVSAAASRKASVITPKKELFKGRTDSKSTKGLNMSYEEGRSKLLDSSAPRLEGLPRSDQATGSLTRKKSLMLRKDQDQNRSFESLSRQLSDRQLSNRSSHSQRSQKRLNINEDKEDLRLVANITEYKAPPLNRVEDPQDQTLMQLVHDIQKKKIEYKYVFGFMNTLMTITSNENVDDVSREVFEKETVYLKTVFGAALYNRVLDFIIVDDIISTDLLAKLIDRYKFNPYFVKHFKNTSEQFQGLSLYGATIQGDILRVHHNCRMLAKKIEEKFTRIGKAYRFFDLDKSGSIRLCEFQHGLDLLGLRFPAKEIKGLFKYLDRKQDGQLDYDEFCDIIEQRKLMKGIQAEQSVFDENSSFHKTLKGKMIASPFIPIIRADIKEKPKFIDYRKQEDESSVSEYVSLDHRRRMMKTASLRKASVGSARRLHDNLPSDTNPNFMYGKKSEASESMRDIMANNYQREWLEKARAKEEKKEQEKRSKSRPKKYHTDASIKRSEHIKKIYENSSNSFWKLDRSSRPGSRLSISRRSKIDMSLNSSFMNQSSYSTRRNDNLNVSML